MHILIIQEPCDHEGLPGGVPIAHIKVKADFIAGAILTGQTVIQPNCTFAPANPDLNAMLSSWQMQPGQ